MWRNGLGNHYAGFFGAMYEYVYLCAIDPIQHAMNIRVNSGSFRLK